jgi:hypothetical protein
MWPNIPNSCRSNLQQHGNFTVAEYVHIADGRHDIKYRGPNSLPDKFCVRNFRRSWTQPIKTPFQKVYK